MKFGKEMKTLMVVDTSLLPLNITKRLNSYPRSLLVQLLEASRLLRKFILNLSDVNRLQKQQIIKKLEAKLLTLNAYEFTLNYDPQATTLDIERQVKIKICSFFSDIFIQS